MYISVTLLSAVAGWSASCGSFTPVLMTLAGMVRLDRPGLPRPPAPPTGKYFTFPIWPRPIGSARSSPIVIPLLCNARFNRVDKDLSL